jgi:hypothetical protein
MRGTRRLLVLFMVLVGAMASGAACELQEVTSAQAEDVVLVEMVLRAGDSVQTAFLFRTAAPSKPAAVTGADVVVSDAAGTSFRLAEAADSLCLRTPIDSAGPGGTCYAAKVSATAVKPAARYSLRVALEDGRVMTAATDVPGAFAVIRPATTAGSIRASCVLDPLTSFDVTWTRSQGASVYLSEARLRNLRQALRASGVQVEGDDAVDLTGLSITAADTTLNFPGDLGIFDRFDTDVFDILIALRNGVPADVDATLVVSAADRNYVNWVRGGNFNPSGAVHISSIRGDGAGLFGSVVSRTVLITTRAESPRQRCVP